MAFDSIVQGGRTVLTQDYGQTSWAMGCRCEWTCPGYAAGAFHAGIDIASIDGGEPVLLAAGYGTCVKVGRVLAGYSCSGLGPYAPCIRSGGVDIWYGHAKQSLVSVGEPVWPGKPVAIMDSVGCSTGNHVHFEVTPAGADPDGCNTLNPWSYLNVWPGTPQPCPEGTVGPQYGNCSCAPGWVARNDGSGLCDPAPLSLGHSILVPTLLIGGALLLLAGGRGEKAS